MKLEDLKLLTDGQLVAMTRDSGAGPAAETAFGALWLRYEDHIEKTIRFKGEYQYGSSFCGNVRDRVYDKLRDYVVTTHTESIKAFVNKVLKDCFIDEIRWSEVRDAVPFSASLEPGHDNDLDSDDERPRVSETRFLDEDDFVAASRARETVAMVESDQRANALYGALQVLALEEPNGVKLAEVLQMMHVDGMTQEEIAKHFSKTDRTVRRWYVEAMSRMREILRDRFGIRELEQLL